jgi:hypothetical protein
MAADARFETLVDDVFGAFNVADGVLHLGLSVAYAWLLGGALREMLAAPLRPRAWLDGPARPRAGALEVGVMLVLVDLLFATFVVLQLPYLFGGLAQVERLGYAEYARRGFFELVWVAGLALPLLLMALWLVRGATAGGERRVRWLALALVGLMVVVMASAMQRMWLYVGWFGLTELRVQASACMVWLAIVLGWFVATVLRQRRERFGFGALASGLVMLALLDVLNPDALIVRTNARYGHLEGDAGVRFDARAFASLSPDATPAIVEALPQLEPSTRQQVVALLDPRLSGGVSDWRTFNLSRVLAAQALARSR